MDYFRPGVVEVETAFMSLAVPAMVNPDRIFELVAVVRCVCVCMCVCVCVLRDLSDCGGSAVTLPAPRECTLQVLS
jgi:hypothetical protein